MTKRVKQFLSIYAVAIFSAFIVWFVIAFSTLKWEWLSLHGDPWAFGRAVVVVISITCSAITAIVTQAWSK